jgi:mannose-6-phosphate isomerase
MSPAEPVDSSALAPLREPVRLGRICMEKVWGGRSLERVLGAPLEGEGPIGETWELVDRLEQNSVVRGGPHDGRELRDLRATDREALLGATRPTAEDRFPVLVKYISTSQPLSVQVHPDDAAAERLHAGEAGKTESWYIVDAEPDSQIHLGLREGVDPSELVRAAGGAGVVDLLQTWPVRAGQFVHVPAGTLHAIGKGITLVEVQQNSDVTYRLYDWGRVGLDGAPRPVHVDECLLAATYEVPITGPVTPELVPAEAGGREAHLVETETYGLSLLELDGSRRLETAGRAQALVVLDGRGRLEVEGAAEPLELAAGETWLVPAAAGAYELAAIGDSLRLLLVDTRA